MHAATLSNRHRLWQWTAVAIWAVASAGGVYGSDKKEEPVTKAAPKGDIEASTASNPKEVGAKLREALGTSVAPNKKLILSVNGGKNTPAASTTANPANVMTPAIAPANRRYNQARAAALSASTPTAASASKPADHQGGEAPWSYEGENGPQAWSRLRPEFALCGAGRRQSPINIDESTTLQGPAESIQFSYLPSNGMVVNNGHTIQVDVQGSNSVTVRGSNYQLQEFHFHTPSEEQINFKRTAMVAHLVHRNGEGQLAIVAVLLELGSANPLIDKVWTYMPLDAGDRVRMPNELLNLTELLPTDQRYYQFMGSLTTPPCSEGVLWMVLKQPMTISRAQHRLFTQLYPNNARPLQPLNARPVRDAQ